MKSTYLIPKIKEDLLTCTDEELLPVAKSLGIQVQSVRANLRRNSSQMVLPHVQLVIKQVLNLDQDEEIILFA